MGVYFVSDLHIWGADDPLYHGLLSLIRERAHSGDTLVLAGDIFELLVGNKPIFLQRYSDFLEVLEQASSRGATIHYIEGNHDFLLHRLMSRVPAVKVASERVVLEVGSKKILVVHGDTADREDYAYRFLRAFLRSIFFRFFLWLLPGSWIDQIGAWSSRLSRRKNTLLVSQLPTERREQLRKIYRNFAAEKLTQGFDFVVMGHCHDLDEMSFRIGDRSCQYVNVGFPRVHGTYLVWKPGDEKIRREKFPLDSDG